MMYRCKNVLSGFGIAALLVAASLLQAQAQTPQVSAKIDSPDILIGQRFHLTLEVQSHPGDAQVSWTVIPDTFNHIQVLQRDKMDTLTQARETIFSQKITLTSFDSGLWKIPGFLFRVIQKNDSPAVYTSTDSLFVSVNTVPVDTTQPFKPIKAIRNVPFDIRDYLLYILIGLGAAILAVILVLYLVKRKKPQKPPPPPPPREKPYDTALKALEKLESEKLWQQDQVKLYYVLLTDILRTYLEDQFGITAPEQTTDELMLSIKKVTVVSQQKDQLESILNTADLVKFAKMQPVASDHEDCMKKALEILEWTRPKQEPKPE